MLTNKNFVRSIAMLLALLMVTALCLTGCGNKAADEALAEDANNMIKQYSAYYPQTAEAFMYDVTDGQSYTVSCGGLRATTTVRTQK